MIERIDFDTLTPNQFENFCYDLLYELGCHDVSWRKGTAKQSSPSDFGRDIECLYTKRDHLLGEIYTEKWFVECKHYKQGVPYNELLSILTSCTSQSVDRCVIIASGFLSNSAKETIRSFELSNKPKFKISIWENPKLESLTSNMSHLLRKYNIVYKDSILEYINPYHAEYIRDIGFNELDCFISAFKNLNSKTKQSIVEFLCLFFFSHKIDKIDFSDYNSCFDKLVAKWIFISNKTSQHLIVHSICSLILGELLTLGNPLSIDNQKASIEKDIISIDTNKEKIIRRVKDAYDKDNLEYDFDDEGIIFLKNSFKNSLINIENRQEQYYSMYNEFCNIVLNELIENKVF